MKLGAQKLLVALSVVYFMFLIDESQALGKGKVKFSLKKFATKQRITAKIIIFQTRRHKIVKCCGRESCSTVPGRLRNGTAQTKPPTRNRWNLKKRPTKTDLASATYTAAGISNAENPTNSASEFESTPEVSPPVEPEQTEASAAETETTTVQAVGYTGVTAGVNGDYADPAEPPIAASAPESASTQTNNGLTSSSSLGSDASSSGSTISEAQIQTSTSGPVGTASVSSSTTEAFNIGVTNSIAATSIGQTQPSSSLSSIAASSSTSTNLNPSSAFSTGGSTGISTTTSTPAGITSTSSSTMKGISQSATTSSSTTTSMSSATSTSTATAAASTSTSTTIKTSASTATTSISTTTIKSTTSGTTTTSTTTVATKSNPCMDDACVKPCVKDPALFPGGVLTVPSTRGTVATICSKNYFMSVERVNQSIARQACCAMGMTLSNLETRAEQDCITKYNDDVAKKLAIYWVGATDRSCPKNFTWCTGSQLNISMHDWIIAQPNYLVNQSCLVHVTDYGRSVPFFGFVAGDNGFNDWECYAANEYLCEAP